MFQINDKSALYSFIVSFAVFSLSSSLATMHYWELKRIMHSYTHDESPFSSSLPSSNIKNQTRDKIHLKCKIEEIFRKSSMIFWTWEMRQVVSEHFFFVFSLFFISFLNVNVASTYKIARHCSCSPLSMWKSYESALQWRKIVKHFINGFSHNNVSR